MSWEEVELCDISEYRTERIEVNLLNEKNYVSTENMLSERGGIVDSSYPPSGNNSPAFKSNDILVSNIRPYFKKIWFAQNDGGCSNDVIVFKPSEEKVDPKFLYYQLSKDEFFDFMMSGANGTKMPRGNKKAIPKFKLLIPKSLPTQKRIASILSAYDNLIENNLKRIKLLEETAQNIYKEWFVNFRFPNYENTPFNQETGLPEGWEVKKISETDLEIGDGNYSSKYPKSSDFIDSGIPFFSTREMSNGRLTIEGVKRISEEQHLTLKKGHLMSGDVLLSTRGSIGKVVYVDDEFEGCNINAQLVYFRCNNTSFYNSFLFYQLSLPENYSRLLNVGTGTAQPQLPIKTLNQFEILYPNSDIQKLFYNKTSLFIKQISALYKQNQKLKEARDILLPRLMNRTIEV